MKKILNFKYLPLLTFLVVAGSAIYINNHFNSHPPMDKVTVLVKNTDENLAVNSNDWATVQSWLNSSNPRAQTRGLAVVQGTRVKEQMAFGVARAEALKDSPDEYVRVGVMITLHALNADSASGIIKAGLTDKSSYVREMALALQMKRAK